MPDLPEDAELTRFLKSRSAIASETVNWRHQTLELRVSTYVCSEPPPDELVTSARCVVIRDLDVLVLTDRDSVRHILPGGRRERDETLMETARREVREEAGLAVDGLVQVGFMLYKHLTPCPEDYPYPYPYFIQVIFTAQSLETTNPHCNDEWVESADFVHISSVRATLPDGQRALLDAAGMATHP